MWTFSPHVVVFPEVDKVRQARSLANSGAAFRARVKNEFYPTTSLFSLYMPDTIAKSTFVIDSLKYSLIQLSSCKHCKNT